MNIYPFDSDVVAMKMVCNDYYQYKMYTDQSEDEFLKFA